MRKGTGLDPAIEVLCKYLEVLILTHVRLGIRTMVSLKSEVPGKLTKGCGPYVTNMRPGFAQQAAAGLGQAE